MAQYIERKGFTFLRSYYESAIKLPDKQRLAVYDAIVKYSFEGAVPAPRTGCAIADAVFALIRPSLDKSLSKSEAGAKGGRSSKRADAALGADKCALCNKQNESRPRANEKQDIGRTEANEKQTAISYDLSHTARSPAQGEDSAPDLIQQRFDEFWIAYPRKIGKGAAKKAWSRIKPTTELHSKILTAIAQQKSSSQWKCDGGQYIPNPLTWLNQMRWEDEPQKYTGPGTGTRISNRGGFKQREYSDGDFEHLMTNEFGGN